MPRYAKTLYSDNIFIECAVDPKHIHRQRFRVDFRASTGDEAIEVHRRGSLVGDKVGRRYRYNTIIVSPFMTREDFIKTLKRHFSLDFSVEPQNVTLEFENFMALWGGGKQ